MGNLVTTPQHNNAPLSHPWWTQVRTSLFWMVIFALALRLGLIFVGHTYRFRTDDNNFHFGWEMGRIGSALASGQGFNSPFSGASGPTAWEPPLYPFLVAGVFKVFGIYTHASAIVLLTMNSIFAALTCIPIFLIAKRCFNEQVATWTAWLWALLPNIAYWSTRWIWETSLAALLLAVIFLLTLELEEKDGIGPWMQFGLLWAIAALTNTSLLAFLPVSGLWAWRKRWKSGRRSVIGVTAASFIFCACITPWLLRNYRTFGQFVFIRSNFGAELRIGNGTGADGTWQEYLHPTQNAYEMRRFLQMGELPYVAQRKQEARVYIRKHPWRFFVISLKRFFFFWGGIPKVTNSSTLAPFQNSIFLASSVLAFWGLGRALRKRVAGAWLFFWLILSCSAIYYVVFPHPRYRHPIEPELGILIVYVISEAQKKHP